MAIDNPELDLANNFVQFTNRNVFLTGKAGTGKTTFLHRLKENTQKRMVVVAPTGVAAINAGGVTIHSFFQMPFGPIIPDTHGGDSETDRHSLVNRKFNKKKIAVIKSMDLLVIDEISMVRADLLDGVDLVLRRYKDRNKVFGGVQVLMIGDLQQLAPIVKPDEWELLKPHYDTGFFFSSKAFHLSQALGIELKHIYRQSNEDFINILNEIRDGRLSESSVVKLHKQYRPGHIPDKDEGYITLTTHNANAQSINDEHLGRIDAEQCVFEADINGNFPEYSYPTEDRLTLKTGAQVMFVKNDTSHKKSYYNGKIGTVTNIDDDVIYVTCNDDEESICVGPELWENVNYTINEKTKEMEEEVVGSFTQYPLRLAWAITIHKSQGLTFEKAIIDAGASFAHGQAYVALSRCKSLQGIILSSRISDKAIICDRSVVTFNKHIEENPPDVRTLYESRVIYQFELLEEMFDYLALRSLINRCLYLLRQHDGIVSGNLYEILSGIQQNEVSELNRISPLFEKQLKSLMVEGQDVESNAAVQERIKKACGFYSDKTEKCMMNPLDEATFATDNQSVKKLINESLVKIREELIFKRVCLKGGKNGFRVEDYLKVRARAFVKKHTARTSSKTTVQDLSSGHPELSGRLQSWRKRSAEKEGVPLSRIATLKALVDISNKLPVDMAQLKTVNGMGKKRVSRYGEMIVSIVLEYCREKNLLNADGKVKQARKKIIPKQASQQTLKF